MLTMPTPPRWLSAEATSMNPLRLAAIGLIRFYQYFISPFWPGVCRYGPSCSEYGREAIERHGVLYGGWLTLRRLSRCHPWGGSGYDPVPPVKHSVKSTPASRSL